MKQKKELHRFNHAGRMIKAAVITALARDTSIDRTLRRLPEDAGEEWGRLAEQLMRGMQGEVTERLFAAQKAPKPPLV